MGDPTRGPRALVITQPCPTCSARCDEKCRAIQGPHRGQLVGHLHATRYYAWRDTQRRRFDGA